MVRTQVQLTEAQAAKLKALAARQDVSIAEMIRRAVDQLPSPHVYSPEQKRLALAFVGQFPDEATDVAENHDLYLAEIYAQVAEPNHS